MNLTTKGDLVNASLRKLGVASNATLTDVEPQSVEDAVSDLEMMMAEWLEGDSRVPGINIGYIFSEPDVAPDPGDAHGVSTGRLSAIIHNLACRIAPDYGVEPSPKLVTLAKYGKEQLVKVSVFHRSKRSPYPPRMPIGSGNHWATLNEWHFYPGRRNANSTTPSDEGDE